MGRSGAGDARSFSPRRSEDKAIAPSPDALCARNPRRLSRSRPAMDKLFDIGISSAKGKLGRPPRCVTEWLALRGESMDVHELIGVEQRPAQCREPVLAHQRLGAVTFARSGFTPER